MSRPFLCLALGYSSWADYCRERWQFGRNYASKMIGAADAVEAMGTSVPAPSNEAVTRELAPIARADPERAREVWAEAAEHFGPTPIARQVAAVGDQTAATNAFMGAVHPCLGPPSEGSSPDYRS